MVSDFHFEILIKKSKMGEELKFNARMQRVFAAKARVSLIWADASEKKNKTKRKKNASDKSQRAKENGNKQTQTHVYMHRSAK